MCIMAAVQLTRVRVTIGNCLQGYRCCVIISILHSAKTGSNRSMYMKNGWLLKRHAVIQTDMTHFSMLDAIILFSLLMDRHLHAIPIPTRLAITKKGNTTNRRIAHNGRVTTTELTSVRIIIICMGAIIRCAKLMYSCHCVQMKHTPNRSIIPIIICLTLQLH